MQTVFSNSSIDRIPTRTKFIKMWFLIVGVGLIFLCAFIARRLSPKSLKLDGSHVLVTGGSSGIGKAVAIGSAKLGANVTILARNKLRLEEAKTEIQQHLKQDRSVHCISVDLTGDYAQVEKAVKEAESKFGPVGMLVNSAGMSVSGRFLDLKPEDFKQQMEMNYLSATNTTKAALPSMIQQQRGRIVFLSSQAGQIGLFGFTAYSGSKFALRGMAEALQMEVLPYNIRVTMAYPPDTDTPGFQQELQGKPKETKLISETAGLLKPEKVADAILTDAINGKFTSFQGLDGFLLAVVTTGVSPATSLLDVVIEFFAMGIFRIVSLFYLASFDSIVLKCKKERDQAKEKES